MSDAPRHDIAVRHGITHVQLAVLAACVEHARVSFLPLTPEIWWRAEPPFRGGRSTFAAHLRALEQMGLLARTSAQAAYRFTLRGEHFAVTATGDQGQPEALAS